MPKLDKILITVVLVLLLVLIILLGYVFVSRLFTPQLKDSNQSISNVLNIDRDQLIQNPKVEDVQKLLDKIKKKNDVLLKNVEGNKEDL